MVETQDDGQLLALIVSVVDAGIHVAVGIRTRNTGTRTSPRVCDPEGDPTVTWPGQARVSARAERFPCVCVWTCGTIGMQQVSSSTQQG